MASSIIPQVNKQVIGTAENPVVFTNGYKVISDMTGDKDASGMVLDYFKIEGVQQRGINLESGLTVGFTARNGTISARGLEAITAYPMGIAVKNARDITFENLTIEGFTTRPTGDLRYFQGDGMVLEPNAIGVTTKNITVRGCMDGNLDSKAQQFVSTGYYRSEEGGYNFRIWYNEHKFENAISVNPDHGHFQLTTKTGGQSALIADRVEVRNNINTSTIFNLSSGSKIRIKEMLIDVLPGTKLFGFSKAGLTLDHVDVELPDYVTVDANGYVINCTPPVVVLEPAVQAGLDFGEVLKDNSGNGLITLTTYTTVTRINAYLKAHGSPVVLKRYDVVRSLGGTFYELV